MTGSTVEQLQALNAQAVLKFQVGGLLFADSTATAPDPTTLVAADGTVTVPAGYTSGGLITTDGITKSRSLTVDVVNAWQTLATIRSDISSDQITFKAKLQEYNLVSYALRNGLTLAAAATTFSSSGMGGKRDTSGTQPSRRCLIVARDTQRNVTLVQIAPNMILSGEGDEQIGRATELQLDATFNCNLDSVYGTDFATAANGPGWASLVSGLLTVTPATASLSMAGVHTVQLVVKSGTTDVTASSTFATSDASKATVNSSGLVTGVAVGTATITASYNGATATSAITVTA